MSKFELEQPANPRFYPGSRLIMGVEYFVKDNVLYPFWMDDDMPGCDKCKWTKLVIKTGEPTCSLVTRLEEGKYDYDFMGCKVLTHVMEDNGTRCLFTPKEVD